MSLTPENFRLIADKILQLVNEAEKMDGDTDSEENDRKSLDDLLSSPAGAKKLADQIDKNKLVSKLKLDTHDGDALWSTIQDLSKDSPIINKENSISILQAFLKIAPKNTSGDMLNLNENTLIEGYNKNFDDMIEWSSVKEAITKASKISPQAKDHALHLTNVLKLGMQKRNLDEGLEGVFNAVVYAIEIAERGNRSELLHMFDDFETKYQDDNYSFDTKLWTDLIKYLKLLAKEVLLAAK
jgi:hypothetical protein